MFRIKLKIKGGDVLLFFTNPLEQIQAYITDKTAHFHEMVDYLTTLVLLGFGIIVLILVVTLFLLYKIYRQTSKGYVDRIRAEVERDLIQKYQLELREDYKKYLQKK